MGWIPETAGQEADLRVAVGMFHGLTRARVTPSHGHDGEHRVIVASRALRLDPGEVLRDEVPAEVASLERPIRFGDVATLLASTVALERSGPAALVEITLYLRAERRTETPHSIFVHVEGAEGRKAVSDHSPGAGTLETTTWPEGMVVVDQIYLDPGELNEGPLSVHAGMFSEDQRLASEPAEAESGERRVHIAAIE